VKPADVISAIRQLSYQYYARPSFLGKLVSDPAWLPLAIAIPVVVIIAILSLAGTFKIPQGPVDYSAFFPHGLLNGTFSAITLFFYLLASLGIGRFWNDMKRQTPPGEAGIKRLPVYRVLREILSHSNFSGCGSRKPGKAAHMLLFFGFALLILVTLYAIWATLTHHYPLPITNPVKILGNLASVMIYAGLGIMTWQRLFNKSVFGKSGYSDWLLLVSIGLLTLSGTLVQLARLGDWSVAYHLYFFHLVAVWFVIMYLPFTKLGHIFYRTTALLYARSIGRK
jgi:quinone-modifying oxidoreductase subunit QmoC